MGERQSTLPVYSEFHLETGLTVQVEVPGSKRQSAAKVVGSDEENLIVLRLPNDAATDSGKLFKGNSIVLRYVFDGIAYGFQCTSRGTISTPERLLFLAFPAIVATKSLREHQRQRCGFPGELLDGDDSRAVHILDISTTGMLLQFFEPPERLDEEEGDEVDDTFEPAETFPVDTTLSIKFSLPGSTDALASECVVRNVQPSLEASRFRGIALTEPSEELSEAIRKYISAMTSVHDG